MKKTAPKKTAAKKVSPKRTAPKKTTRRSASSEPITFTFRRIVFIGGFVLLLLAVIFVPSNKQTIQQDVAGLSIARPLFNQATVELPKVENAASYNIYYKQTTEADFNNSVSKIPTNISHYTISYLKKGADYEYKISVADGSGKEFSWTEVKPLENLTGM